MCSFLESVLRDPKTSKRLKMSAAARLDDLLRRQERKEAAKARRDEGMRLTASRRQEQALLTTQASADSQATQVMDAQLQAMQDHMKVISQRQNKLQNSL